MNTNASEQPEYQDEIFEAFDTVLDKVERKIGKLRTTSNNILSVRNLINRQSCRIKELDRRLLVAYKEIETLKTALAKELSVDDD